MRVSTSSFTIAGSSECAAWLAILMGKVRCLLLLHGNFLCQTVMSLVYQRIEFCDSTNTPVGWNTHSQQTGKRHSDMSLTREQHSKAVCA